MRSTGPLPRTQSALLEAMGERQVTVDQETVTLPVPFLVLATQNPIELEGTFPLPEAQIDRFLLRLRLGYPSEDDEEAMLERFETADPLSSLKPRCNCRRRGTNPADGTTGVYGSGTA